MDYVSIQKLILTEASSNSEGYKNIISKQNFAKAHRLEDKNQLLRGQFLLLEKIGFLELISGTNGCYVLTPSGQATASQLNS